MELSRISIDTGRSNQQDMKEYTQALKDLTPVYDRIFELLDKEREVFYQAGRLIKKITDNHNQAYFTSKELGAEFNLREAVSSREVIRVRNIENLTATVKNKLYPQYSKLNEFVVAYKDKLLARKSRQDSVINGLNEQGKMLWNLTQSGNTTFDRGDSVCDYSNKMGYIEDQSAKRVKVMWIKQVVNEPSGFWFGNMGYHIIDRSSEDLLKYQVSNINNTVWVDKNKLANCSFDS